MQRYSYWLNERKVVTGGWGARERKVGAYWNPHINSQLQHWYSPDIWLHYIATITVMREEVESKKVIYFWQKNASPIICMLSISHSLFIISFSNYCIWCLTKFIVLLKWTSENLTKFDFSKWNFWKHFKTKIFSLKVVRIMKVLNLLKSRQWSTIYLKMKSVWYY